MKTLLLLAGRSKRFWPLKEKTLFPLCGKTLLEHQVERLKKGGCTEIILVGGAHNLKDASSLFPKFQAIKQQDQEMGMQGALLSALPKCGKDSVMIVSANDVIDPSAYKSLTTASKKKDTDGVILAKKVDRYFPGGYLTVKGTRAMSIVEKPGAGKEPSQFVNIVAHIHNDASVLLKAVKEAKSKNDDGYERALDVLMKDHSYQVVAYTGEWQAVKYPWHFLSLLPSLLSQIQKQSIDKSCQIHKTAVIEGPVILEKGVRVFPHATIIGPCYIGAGTIIGNNALVRGSSIGEKCVIGYNSEIKSSVLASHIWTHMTYVGDSVIGKNVSFGGGSMTGNFRLDEGEISSVVNNEAIPTGLDKLGAIIGENTRIGIQVGMNPGVKIGEGSFISGGLFLTEDVAEKSYVVIKDGKLLRKENRSPAPTIDQREKFRK